MPARSAVRSLLVAIPALLALAACGAGDEPPTEPAGETASRTVAHARGESEVPADPQRVVVLEPVQLDTAVALGEIPVGAAVPSEATGAEAASIATVGTVAEPSIEKIAALDPDLILGTESRHAAIYDTLSGIAPTVFMATQADPWPDNVQLVGRTLGAEA